MWTVLIRDQTIRSVLSDLDLYCPQKASCLVTSKERVTGFRFTREGL